jgi:hypothetical protein
MLEPVTDPQSSNVRELLAYHEAKPAAPFAELSFVNREARPPFSDPKDS